MGIRVAIYSQVINRIIEKQISNIPKNSSTQPLLNIIELPDSGWEWEFEALTQIQ
jgi:hypothetical protein